MTLFSNPTILSDSNGNVKGFHAVTKRYQIQVGFKKGSYKTRWAFDNLGQAQMWYNGINVWNGYKKRILDLVTGKVLYREITV